MNDELRFIWEVAPIGFAKVGRDGRFLAVNPRYAEMVGYSETELLGRTWQGITHPDDLAPDNTEAEKLASGSDETSYQMVKRYISKDGRTVWVNLYVYAVRDAHRAFSHFFVFAGELTPVSIHADSSSLASAHRKDSGQVPSFIDYLRANPREAALIGGALILIAQGKSIAEVITSIFK